MNKVIAISQRTSRSRSGLVRGGARAVASGLLAGFLALAVGQSARAAGDEIHIEAQKWSFNGVFGTFDKGQLQRGFKVYKEVCSACHAMKLLSYRNLGEAGGPGFSQAEVKAIAASVEVTDGPNEDGDMFERPGFASDAFIAPFDNDNAARASNNGALPPDLSVIAKARLGGADYLYALLTGYKDAPADFKLQDGMSYNAVFPGHQIAMPSPVSDDTVDYDDGTPASAHNLARDVSAFLMWAAEPKMEARKRIGFQVIIFLLVLAGLLYLTTRKIWDGEPH